MGGTVSMDLIGETIPEPPYTGTNKCTSVTRLRGVQIGDGDGKYERVYCDDSDKSGVIAASGSISVDLQTALDVYGVALNANDVAAMKIVNSGLGDLVLRPNASNGWTGLVAGTTPTISIPSGMTFMFFSNTDGKMPVTGTNKVFDLLEVGGANSVAYEIQIWTRNT